MYILISKSKFCEHIYGMYKHLVSLRKIIGGNIIWINPNMICKL